MDANKAIDSFAWPLIVLAAIVIFLLLFRAPITSLFSRARRLGYGNKSIDLDEPPAPVGAQQTTKVEGPPTGPDPVSTSFGPPPPPSPPVAAVENEINAALASGAYPPDQEKAWLIRTLALVRIARAHEITYRLITGSQLELLLRANTPTPPTVAQAQQMYEAAKAAFPDAYRQFPFETWRDYPINIGFLKGETLNNDAILRITPLGQDFLHYLVDNNLTGQKGL